MCPEGVKAKLRPVCKSWVQLWTIASIPVSSTHPGHGYVKGRPQLYDKNGIEGAQGPPILTAGEPLNIQAMHLGATPLRLTTIMIVGYINPYEGPT